VPRRGITQRLHAWLFSEALPFWLDRGWDRARGGAVEELGFDGRDAALPLKRTRVVCRQVYVYAHAALLGWRGGLDFVAAGADYLATRVWQGEADGFARLMTRDGAVHDPMADLYDTAFALHAFAWAYRATGEAAYRDWAVRTLAFVEARLRHPGGEGYLKQTAPQGWRVQNPHMHLLEASLAALEATRDTAFEATARALVGLFEKRFYDAPSGLLSEYFTEDWLRAPGPDGEIVEPGHQFEWAWILAEAGRLIGLDQSHAAQRLVETATRLGVDPQTSAVRNSVRRDGAILDGGSRTWPNTERIKAAIALLELTGADPWPAIEESAGLLLGRYLTPAPGREFPRGGWHDAFDAHGKPIAMRMPASTFYHLFLAFAEVLRIDP
jgi:N-acylglucosamine 2-epimerase/mannose-6-phosphate isomerase